MSEKHKWIRLIAMIQVCLLMLTALTYSWFSRGSVSGSRIRYDRQLAIGSRQLSFTTYRGEKSEQTLQVGYSAEPLGETFCVTNIGPGERVYFKTVIRNTDEGSGAQVSIFLRNIFYSASLGGNEKVLIQTTSPSAIDNYLPEGTPDDSGLCKMESARLTDAILLDAGGTANVFWSVYLSPDLGNEAENAALQFDGLRIVYSN